MKVNSTTSLYAIKQSFTAKTKTCNIEEKPDTFESSNKKKTLKERIGGFFKRFKTAIVASLASVAKIPFKDAQDGISNTFTIIPGALGKEDQVFAGDIEIDLNK